MQFMAKGELTIMTDKSKDRPISEVTLSSSNTNERQIIFDVILASVDGQKFIAQKVIISTSSIFFKKLLVNNLNHHPLICMRKIENESHMLH